MALGDLKEEISVWFMMTLSNKNSDDFLNYSRLWFLLQKPLLLVLYLSNNTDILDAVQNVPKWIPVTMKRYDGKDWIHSFRWSKIMFCLYFTIFTFEECKSDTCIFLLFSFFFFYECTHLAHMDSFKAFLLMLSGFIRSIQSKMVSPITVYLCIYVSIYVSNWQGLVN